MSLFTIRRVRLQVDRLQCPAWARAVATMVQSVLPRRRVVSKHSPTKLTYEDYLQFPDDGLRHHGDPANQHNQPPGRTRRAL
jgi:hypothetical protein